MQLATSAGNQPWCCTLHFAHDENLNLYWVSRLTRRHSKEIVNNSNAAAVIVKPHTKEQKPQGIQVEGRAKSLTPGEDLFGAGWKTLLQKYPGMHTLNDQVNRAEGDDHVLYVLSPKTIKLFDVVNYPDHPEQTLTL